LALEERVREGDESVTPEQIAGQRELGRFARQRVAATQRKAERAREAQRQRALAELADTVRACADDAERLVRLAQAAGRAMEAFVAACEERESWVYQMRERMHALGVPVSLGERDTAPVPGSGGRSTAPSASSRATSAWARFSRSITWPTSSARSTCVTAAG
jgi:hypothetical protein